MNGKRANMLDGRKWVINSISVWDIIKTPEENKLGHPAMFPVELCDRLIETYTMPGDYVLDPFLGCGSTLVSSKSLGRNGFGFEINQEYVNKANKRISLTKWATKLDLNKKKKQSKLNVFKEETQAQNHLNTVFNMDNGIDFEMPVEKELKIINESCYNVNKHLSSESIDFVLTSPPYWDILRQKRTADYKEARPYSDDANDLGNIESYNEFINAIGDIFTKIHEVLKPGKYCAIIVMDIRKKDQFYPLHSDLATEMVKRGYKFEDIIVWNRAREYNNLRALGYPYVFRVNKVHEYILLFSKNGVNANNHPD